MHSLQIPFLANSHKCDFWSLSFNFPFLAISTSFPCKSHSLQIQRPQYVYIVNVVVTVLLHGHHNKQHYGSCLSIHQSRNAKIKWHINTKTDMYVLPNFSSKDQISRSLNVKNLMKCICCMNMVYIYLT